MPSLRPIYPAIHLAVACLILAMGLRTWLVIGWIEPVTVAGSSMVPTLQNGDRLWIDRTALLWHRPQRWEVVVARNPYDASELCVKRIVGLPGEQVALRDGDVLVEGAVVVKSIAAQRALRQIVHREERSDRRWHAEQATGWRWDETSWQHRAQSGSQPNRDIQWLHYQQRPAQPITDDVPSNAGLSRKLHLVDDFFLSAELIVQGSGSLRLTIDDGTATAAINLRLPEGQLTLVASKQRSSVWRLSARSLERLVRGKVQVEFSNFDQQLLLVIDQHVELRRPWPRTKAAGTARPVSIGAQGLSVRLRNLTLYRDLYHSSQAVGAPPPQVAHWQLGPDDYFLLGDNAPVSLDSRLWGPVSGRLLVGKPLP